jgi:hypothetical protein
MFKETNQRTLEEIDILFWRSPVDNQAQRRDSKEKGQPEPAADGQIKDESKKA